MGFDRAKREGIEQECFDEFEALPSIAPKDLTSPYITIAVRLSMGTSPNSPMSGYIIYDTEIIQMTAKTMLLFPCKTITFKGHGVPPKWPIHYHIISNRRIKIIDQSNPRQKRVSPC